MPRLVHTVEPDVAEAIRDHVALLETNPDPLAWVSPLMDVPEVFAPKGELNLVIETREKATAKCRECGEPIRKGVRAIRFGYDPYLADTGGRWGSLSAAFIHHDPAECGKEEAGA